jgi:predicted O-methyltransferase YrrM
VTASVAKLRTRGISALIKLLVNTLIFRQFFGLFERLGLHVLPVHYYSPVPDTRELRAELPNWYRESSLVGIDLNMDGQMRLLSALGAYRNECQRLPNYETVVSMGLGDGYGEVESHLLHSMIRELKPNRVLEVGSGVSTFFSANALSMNRREQGIESKLVCVEPHPRPALVRMTQRNGIELVPRKVQAIEPELLQTLGKGDILFIDSSHMVKLNSDVNYLYLEVLPRLRAGVHIHIHDITFPYPAQPPVDDWVFRRHLFWSEPALVQAFLMYNHVFRTLLSSSYLACKAPEALRSTFEVYTPGKHFPSALWLEKVC